jgi:hypothetical protein
MGDWTACCVNEQTRNKTVVLQVDDNWMMMKNYCKEKFECFKLVLMELYC